MEKNLKNLGAQQFDIVIVGSGIHGAILAYEAARSGYSVALLEKGDFGNATSANSLKIIHGGIRYLQHGDIRRMRESIESRRSMMSFAPHLVKPLACLMPTYGHGLKGREMMRLAFAIYDIVAFDRNSGIAPENRLPCGGRIGREEVKRVVREIPEDNLTGGAVWYDAIAENSERLILEYVREATRYGAVVANYCEVEEVTKQQECVTGVVARDVLSGSTVDIGCGNVVNAAGPWLDRLGNGGEISNQQWSTAINLVVKRKLFHKYAVGLEGFTDYTDKDAIIKRGKRLFFFVPWHGDYTMIGTTYKPYKGKIDDFSLERHDLQEVLNDVNKIYPQGDLLMDDITFFHGGLLPMAEADDYNADKEQDTVQLDKSSKILSHASNGGIKGLFSIKGVKYTTAPDIAEKVLKTMVKEDRLRPPEKGCYTDLARLQQSDLKDFGPVINKLGSRYQPIRNHLKSIYGDYWRKVFRYLAAEDGLKAGWESDDRQLWISEKKDLLVVEVLYFIRQEMACTLSDVVLRRSSLGSAECPDQAVLTRVAEIMGRELNWSDEDCERQISNVKAYYGPLQG